MEKLRAVSYNRCSTEEESQKDALLKQVQESVNCIYEKGWELTDTYVEAKSGTTAKGRSEYNRLFQNLETNAFDIIVIKSQDRLMRNTKDWYLFLDRMQKYNKRLYMYLEQKFYTPDDSLITGIKAILAEEYSRELSKKINNAHRNRQREGQRFVITNQTYGYRKKTDKSIAIDEKEAEMIRMIFQLAAEGYGTHCSAEILYQNGYRNRKGNMLSSASLCKIIRNPLYKGDVVQNRQHYDFESRQIHRNPEEEWIIHKNAVPAIVGEELFEAANRSMDKRRTGKNGHPPDKVSGIAGSCGSADAGSIPDRNGVYGLSGRNGAYGLSGRLYCGLCGKPYYRTYRLRKQEKIVEWKCSTYLQKGRRGNAAKRKNRRVANGQDEGCDNVHINERSLYRVLRENGGKGGGHPSDEADVLQEITAVLQEVLRREYKGRHGELQRAELGKIRRQEDILLSKLLDGVITDADYKMKKAGLLKRAEEIEGLLKQEASRSDRQTQRILPVKKRLEEGIFEQAQAAAVLADIERITVFPSHIEIRFHTQQTITVTGQCATRRIP